MSGSLLEVLTENERHANRSCAVAGLWVAAVLALVCLIGLTGVFGISCWWMVWYAGVILLPILAIVVYAKRRDYRGSGIKHLMVLVATLVPAGIAVPTLFGFFLMPLPIVVAGRYLSRRFVWETYLMTLVLACVMMVPHAYFGVPSYPLCDEAKNSLQLFLDGGFKPIRYLRYLIVFCYPSYAICLSFFAIAMDRLCRDGHKALDHQAKVHARLSDVEKGLAIAATMEMMGTMSAPGAEAATVRTGDEARTVAVSATGTSQPDVRDWSTAQIVECISRCKERAAADAEFAALVERDPAAAVREMQR